MTDNFVGQQVGGFVIGQLIARGGMGSIYQAFKPGVQHLPLAIKLMLPEYTADDEFRSRFEREANLLKTLDHPHIMPVYSVGEENGVMWFVMPFVRGPSLFDLLERRHFNPLTAWQIINPLTQALHYAHQRGVIHRDVKPANILIEARKPEGNHIYLLDFGLSKISGSRTLTQQGFSVGTPHYMAPEQIMGKKNLTAAVDIYAMGVLTYELLLGRLPFPSRKPQTVTVQHIKEPPPAPRSLNPTFPRALEAVLLRALEKEALNRFATAEEFRIAYARAVQDIDAESRKGDYWVLPEAER